MVPYVEKDPLEKAPKSEYFGLKIKTVSFSKLVKKFRFCQFFISSQNRKMIEKSQKKGGALEIGF